MVVAADVKNMDNMLLIPAGATLTERQIDILMAWGVGEIEVEAAEEIEGETDPLEKLTPEVRTKLTEEIKGLFWRPNEADPVFQEVFNLMLRRRARKEGSR